jgi:hypothetical protein
MHDGFCISEDDILHGHRHENLRSYRSSECELHSCSSEHCPLAGCCESGEEPKVTTCAPITAFRKFRSIKYDFRSMAGKEDSCSPGDDMSAIPLLSLSIQHTDKFLILLNDELHMFISEIRR